MEAETQNTLKKKVEYVSGETNTQEAERILVTPTDAAADALCLWMVTPLSWVNITGEEFMLKYTTFIDALETWIHSIEDGKHVGSLNIGDGLSPRTLMLVVEHYAPARCRPYEGYCGCKHNKIDRLNPCISVWRLAIARSLCNEAGAAWSTEL